MAFITYAQNFEDLLLYRCFKDIKCGFYIDVGANLPEAESVTKAFYDSGWNGINIEPTTTCFAQLVQERPRDININMAVWHEAGEQTLYLVELSEALATLEPNVAKMHRDLGRTIREVSIQTTTLAQICEQQVGERQIHFLKVDVEGAELNVFRGADFNRWRPYIILSEGHGADFDVNMYQPWEDLLHNQEYRFVYTDGLNRYYIASEHYDHLAQYFRVPPNVYDDWIRSSEIKLRQSLKFAEETRAIAWHELAVAQERVRVLETEILSIKGSNFS